MKAKIIFIGFILSIGLNGCQKDGIYRNSLSGSEGLSLYWNHRIFGEEGRGFIFEFYENQRDENFYELIFKYDIDNKRKDIDIYLIDKIDKGKCPMFPSPNRTDNLCISNGDIFIPEDMLKDGDYTFTIRTADFMVKSSFTINLDKVTLKIPDNEYFSSSIEEVFPTPVNLLYGNVVFTGEGNTEFAHEFFKKLESLGLKEVIVANPPFNLSVDDSGKPENQHWPPDNHSLAFLYSMNVSFQRIFELSNVYFNKYDLNIYLFSSNGDQAYLSKINGIVVQYAD